MDGDCETVRAIVRQFVRSTQNVIANPKDSDELTNCLLLLKSLLPDGVYNSQLPFKESLLQKAKKEFAVEHYGRLSTFIIQQFSVDWIKWIPKHNVQDLLDHFFLYGVKHEAFMSLSCGIEQSSASYKQQKCTSLLEQFLQTHLLADVFWDQCLHPAFSSFKEDNKTTFSSVSQSVLMLSWEDLISSIVSLPDKMANALKQENSEFFLPRVYIPLVAMDMLTCLQKVHTYVKASKDCSIQFLSLLFGKLCLNGYSDQIWDTLLHKFTVNSRTDYIWCRVCHRLITSVPDRCLESVIVPLIKRASWYGVISKLLQDTVVKNTRLKHLLTTKLLLMRHFDDNVVVQNIIGYITSSLSTRPLFIPVFLKLLNVWGDKMAMKRTSYEQHLYITKAIMVCISFTNAKERKQHRDELLSCLMPGVQNHIGDSSPKMQKLGMVVAENLTMCIETVGEKLQFQYETDSEVEELLSLLTPPVDPGEHLIEESLAAMKMEGDITDECNDSVTKNDIQSQDEEELDSDDDLEPYDMSNDSKVTKVKLPVYIRDCMEGLISSDDADRVEVCLLSAEKLIRRKPDNLTEIAVEFTKILLHLQNNFSMLAFPSAKQMALVALTVHSPVEVADYLGIQFYDRNYNIRQRMDMLQVLSTAAQELSQPPKHGNNTDQNKPSQAVTSGVEPKHWRQIVEERIEKKTRRFVKGKSKPLPPVVESRFAPVAGHFFFPLLRNFDRPENTFDLVGEDCLVLERLLYTLGMVIHCATNSLICKQMGKTMLEFVWVLRYHTDVSVRRALLFCICMTFLSVPGFVLVSDLQSEVMETKSWLEDTINRDEDTECRKLASHAILLMQHVAQQEFTDKS